jgi:hypothetical protein
LRRLLHLALLLTIMLGIRACGGMAVTEDRLGAATRWTAEKVGLANTKDAFDATVRPPMAAATRSLSDGIYAATARTMDNVELAAGSFSGWIVQNVRAGLGLIDGSLQPVVAPDPATARERRDAESYEERERRASRSQ